MSGEQLWRSQTPAGQTPGGQMGSASQTFPIRGNGPEPWFRDRLDALRSARIPTAMYPDGYLGTLNTRRGDRLRVNGGARQNVRNYQRGIHVGARVEPQQYFWSDEVHPQAGLEAQARGEKFTQKGGYDNTYLTNDGKPMPRGAASLIQGADGYTKTVYARLAPNWK